MMAYVTIMLEDAIMVQRWHIHNVDMPLANQHHMRMHTHVRTCMHLYMSINRSLDGACTSTGRVAIQRILTSKLDTLLSTSTLISFMKQPSMRSARPTGCGVAAAAAHLQHMYSYMRI